MLTLLTSKLKALTTIVAVLLFGLIFMAHTGHAKADSCTPYDPNSSISTPVYNNFCGVPQGVGNEPDFVRVRQNSNGNDEDNTSNPAYTDTLNAACNSGDTFDVWNYVHNNAASGYNDNGNGTSVAKGVTLAMKAPINTTNDNFSFFSAIAASNAGGKQDTATLTCSGGKQVNLSLVASSVHVYSAQYNWHDLPDSAVNSTSAIGSPVLGSGIQWGCWDYRIVVVYEVKVTATPPQVVSNAMCTIAKGDIVTSDDRTVKVTLSPSLQNATVLAYQISWGDNSAVSTTQTATHQYAQDGNYNIVAKVQVKLADGTTQWVSGDSCNQSVSFKANQPPVVLTSTPTPTTPAATTLINTGPGDVVGIFGGVTVLGALLHKLYIARKAVRL